MLTLHFIQNKKLLLKLESSKFFQGLLGPRLKMYNVKDEHKKMYNVKDGRNKKYQKVSESQKLLSCENLG